MTIDELIEEVQKLRGWLGGNGNAPAYADGFQIVFGKIENGRAVLITNSQEAMETAEKIEEEAEERVGAMLSNAKDEATDAFDEAVDAIKDLESDGELQDEVAAIFKELRRRLELISVEP